LDFFENNKLAKISEKNYINNIKKRIIEKIEKMEVILKMLMEQWTSLSKDIYNNFS